MQDYPEDARRGIKESVWKRDRLRQGWERQPAGGGGSEAGGGRADVRKPLKTPLPNSAAAEDY